MTANAPVASSEDLVTLTIDGLPVSVPKGTLVIRAAEQLGIQVPRFCDHPLLDPAGACRQCLVEIGRPDKDGVVKFGPKPATSCTETVTPGMVVKTQLTSPVADKAQRGMIEFLLINHPLDCPVCDKGGECPLQNQAMSNGRAESRFEGIKRTFPKPISISSQVLLDRERCVLCQRCTRFSSQIAGDPFISLIERGALSQIGIYEEQPFQSYFSGNTVQICPVGALTGARYRFRARPFDLVSTPSSCEHCASGCALRTDHRRGVVLRRMALNDPLVNEEWNCDKGRWAFEYATLPDRLTAPMVRDEEGVLQPASWPEALAAAADGLKGRTAGVLVGGRVSVEDAYAYRRLASDALGGADIDFRARPTSAEETDFLKAYVRGTYDVTYADLEQASGVLLVGLEPEEESPMIFLRLRKAIRKSKTAVVTIAPYRTPGTEKLKATLLPAAPGTEAEILRALLSNDDQVAAASSALGDNVVVLVGERAAMATGALTAAAALAEARGAKLAWVPRRAGERGALDVGALHGRDTEVMLQAAADGDLDALVVGGVDLDDLRDPALAREAVGRAFVVSLEVRASSVTELADVVLPVAPHQEKAGHFLNWEGRQRPFEQALDTRAMADHRVVSLLAAEMGEHIPARTQAEAAHAVAAEPPVAPTRQMPAAPSYRAPSVNDGEAVLATWPMLLDAGRLQDGEPYLAGTARPPVARLSAPTASALGVADGGMVTVSTARGALTLPLVVTPMPDRVVWLPTNAPGTAVRAVLGASSGDVVTLSKGGVA